MKKILEVSNLRTYFNTFKGVVKAVDGVSFNMYEGEVVGVVGESGGGKSITGFSIIKLIDEPGIINADKIEFNGIDLMKSTDSDMNAIRGKEISMIFQDPMTSLNPVYTIGKQIEEVLIIHRKELNQKERKERCIELLEMVGIPNAKNRLKSYPYQFSGGMRQRVVIAIALASNPKLIIADEPTTALDVTIQAQILNLMKKLVNETKCSLMLITHDLAVVSEITDRINVMYCGKIVETGPTKELISSPIHPYTQGLIDSIPSDNKSGSRLRTIDGIVPNMFDLPSGCAFEPRCKFSTEICKKEKPEIVMSGTRGVSCHNALGGKFNE